MRFSYNLEKRSSFSIQIYLHHKSNETLRNISSFAGFFKPQKSKTKNLIAYHLCLNIDNTVNTYSILSILFMSSYMNEKSCICNFMLLQEDMCTKISESRMNQQLVLFVLLSVISTEKKIIFKHSEDGFSASCKHSKKNHTSKQLSHSLTNRAHSRTWNVIRAGRRSSLSITLNLIFIYTKTNHPFPKWPSALR